MTTHRNRAGAVLRRRQAVGRAGLFVAAALLALVGFRASSVEPSSPSRCGHPTERTARGGWTTAVACGGPRQAAGPLRGPARLLYGERLDLNSADARSLEVIPGIGSARAAAIVAARPFGSVGELERVSGIGPRTVERVAPYLEVSAVKGGGHS